MRPVTSLDLAAEPGDYSAAMATCGASPEQLCELLRSDAIDRIEPARGVVDRIPVARASQ